MRIRNLNESRDEIARLRDRIAADLKSLGSVCSSMSTEVERRYHEEMARSSGDDEGLEEFQTVARSLKRDRQAVDSALGILMNKVRGASGYDFEETAEDTATKGNIANG